MKKYWLAIFWVFAHWPLNDKGLLYPKGIEGLLK
jgi:hypothetical protein